MYFINPFVSLVEYLINYSYIMIMCIWLCDTLRGLRRRMNSKLFWKVLHCMWAKGFGQTPQKRVSHLAPCIGYFPPCPYVSRISDCPQSSSLFSPVCLDRQTMLSTQTLASWFLQLSPISPVVHPAVTARWPLKTKASSVSCVQSTQGRPVCS